MVMHILDVRITITIVKYALNLLLCAKRSRTWPLNCKRDNPALVVGYNSSQQQERDAFAKTLADLKSTSPIVVPKEFRSRQRYYTE